MGRSLLGREESRLEIRPQKLSDRSEGPLVNHFPSCEVTIFSPFDLLLLERVEREVENGTRGHFFRIHFPAKFPVFADCLPKFRNISGPPTKKGRERG